MEFKEIYSFNIYEKKEKTVETESQDENGNTVTVKKKVTEDSPVKVILRKPSRRQIEEAELEYSVEMSRCVKKGILTKAMLVKKYSDTGGLMSETEAKNLYTLYQELFDAQKEYTEAEAVSKDSDKSKEASEKIVRIRDQIVKIEMAYQSLFDHTADMKAQNRLLLWYVLNLTMTQGESDTKPQYYFKGEDFDEKLEDYYAKEESEDIQYFEIVRKISSVAAYWFYNQASSKEDFDKIFQEKPAEQTASEEEPEQEKQEKKPTKKNKKS
jgi:hypothetical protein